MRVVHIAYIFGERNTGGAAIASTRLHKLLLKHGVESHYVCVRKMEDGKNVYELPVGLKRKVFLSLTKITRCVWKFTPFRRSICMNIIPLYGLEDMLSELRPDVVHVQWLNADVASFEQLAKLPYKVIFNLHDLFVINALSPHPHADRRFIDGFSRLNSSLLERYFFERKKAMVSRLHPTFVGPSQWVCKQCRASLIGRGHNVYEIPNLAAIEYIQVNKPAGDFANSKFTILFGAHMGRNNKYKGFPDLVAALHLLPVHIKQKCQLQVYGEDAEACFTEGIETVFLGVVDTPARMIEIFDKADVYAFPSLAETQGMSKVEALLCGLPVIAYDRTACSEGIKHGMSGWIAEDGDYDAYAKGIEYFWGLWQSGALAEYRNEIATKAKRMFSQGNVLDRLLRIYNSTRS